MVTWTSTITVKTVRVSSIEHCVIQGGCTTRWGTYRRGGPRTTTGSSRSVRSASLTSITASSFPAPETWRYVGAYTSDCCHDCRDSNIPCINSDNQCSIALLYQFMGYVKRWVIVIQCISELVRLKNMCTVTDQRYQHSRRKHCR